MGTSWPTQRLGDVLTLQRGFDLPKTDRAPGEYPVVSSSGITGSHKEPRAKGPGVVTGRYGTLGEVFYVESDFWPLNTTLWIRDFKGNDPRFIYYLLQSLDFGMFSDKSSVPGINRNHLHEMRIRFPDDREEQRRIAHILGTLDDKIELNRKMNETLEEIARTLFTSWFVNFDPVRAKAEGREPFGMDAATAALFPDSFVDSELGPIPSGWEIINLAEVVSITKGVSYKSVELAESSTALVTLKSFKRGGGYRHDGLKGFTGKFKSGQVVAAGELIVAQTDVTQAADVIGRPALVLPSSSYSTLVASLDVLIVRPMEPSGIGIGFLHNLLRTEAYLSHVLGFTNGTTVLHLSKDALPRFRFVIPPRELMLQFEGMADVIQRRIEGNFRESELLAEVRDTLLPKLLSGELRVPGVERIAEEVLV